MPTARTLGGGRPRPLESIDRPTGGGPPPAAPRRTTPRAAHPPPCPPRRSTHGALRHMLGGGPPPTSLARRCYLPVLRRGHPEPPADESPGQLQHAGVVMQDERGVGCEDHA